MSFESMKGPLMKSHTLVSKSNGLLSTSAGIDPISS